MLGNFSWFFSCADIFNMTFFQNIISGMPSECQLVLMQIRPDILLGLIWVQTVCKDHQETTKMLLGVKELTTNLGCLLLYFWRVWTWSSLIWIHTVCMQVKINQLLKGKIAADNILSSVWSGLRNFHFKWLETSYSKAYCLVICLKL